jgi:hypothetical protein
MSPVESTSRPCSQAAEQDRRQQDVLAAAQRVGVDVEHAEQARDGAGGAFADEIASSRTAAGGAAKDFKIDNGRPGAAARCVDDELGGVAQALDARSILAPARETFPQRSAVCWATPPP